MSWRVPASIICTAVIYALLQAAANFFVPEPHPMPSGSPEQVVPTLATASAMFVAVALGSWIAQGRFLIRALVLWALPIGLVFWVTYQITLAVKPISIASYAMEFAIANVMLLVSTLTAVLAGVLMGRILGRWQRSLAIGGR